MTIGYDGLPPSYIGLGAPLTPNLGLSLAGMDPSVAENFWLIDVASGSGGTSVFVNSVSVSNPNFNDSTPAAAPGFLNVTWHVSGSDVSASIDTSSISATPAGNNGDVQFNNSGAFGGSDNLFWDNAAQNLAITTAGFGLSILADNAGASTTLIPLDIEVNTSVGGTTTITGANISILNGLGVTSSAKGLQISVTNTAGGTFNFYRGLVIAAPNGSITTVKGAQIGDFSNSGDPSSRALEIDGGIIEFVDGACTFALGSNPIVSANDLTTGFNFIFSGITPGNIWEVLIPDSDSSTAIGAAPQAGKALGSFDVSTGLFTFVSVGTGTVTSVALTMPAIFSVGGSPITTSGTLAVTLATETANTVWAGPTSGGAATPTFRALVTADLPAGTGTVTSFSAGNLSPLFTTSVATATTTPALSFALSNAGGGTVFGNNTTSAAAPAYTIAPVLGIPGTSTGSIAIASSTASGKFTITAPASASTPTLTLPTTSNVLAGQFAGDNVIFTSTLQVASAAGTLTPSLLTQTANTVLAGPSSGGAATPTFRALVAADIPNSTITPIWNNLQNATGALTLANAGNATTFNQTSAVTWTWANTTAATSGVSQSSPIFSINGTYWTGAASATDSWTIKSTIANGTNGTSMLQLVHSGTTGVSAVEVPAGSTPPTWGIKFAGLSQGISAVASNIHFDCGNNNGGINIYNGSTKLSSITHPNTPATQSPNLSAAVAGAGAGLCGFVTSQANSTCSFVGNAAGQYLNAISGAQFGFRVGLGTTLNGAGNLRWIPASGTGAFYGQYINFEVNQTGTSSGSYNALTINVVETALKGTANLLLDLQAGATGGTSEFAINNSGVATVYSATTLVRQGIPSEIGTAVDSTAQSAAIAATNIIASAPRTGMYRISWSATITTAASTSSVLGGTNGFQVGFTSPTDSVAKTVVPGNSTTSAANTTGTAVAGSYAVYAKTGTAITYAFDYTSVGVTAMVYELHVALEAM